MTDDMARSQAPAREREVAQAVQALHQFPLHIHISSLFILLIIVVGGLIGALGYKLGRDVLDEAARDVTARIHRETLAETGNLLAPPRAAILAIRHESLARMRTHAERMGALPLLRDVLFGSDALSSVYFGYADGDFFFLRRLRDAAEREAFSAPEGAAFLVQSIDHDGRAAVGRYVHLDAALRVLREDPRPEYPGAYDPRQRGWFASARASDGLIETAPYLFYSNRKVGLTLAAAAADGAVVAVDILLQTLGESLARQRVTPGSEVVLVDRQGQIVAHQDLATMLPASGADQTRLPHLNESGIPILAALGAQLAGAGARVGQTLVGMPDGKWRVSVSEMRRDALADGSMLLVTAIPESELLADALALIRHAGLLIVAVIVIAIPATWLLARNVSRPLRALAAEAERIRHFDFDRPMAARSLVREVSELAITLESMKRTIRRFLDVSQAVAAERDFDHLMQRLLSETVSAADAKGGVLYLAEEETLTLGGHWFPDGVVPGVLVGSVQSARSGPLLARAAGAAEACMAVLQADDHRATGLAEMPGAPAYAVAVPLRNRQRELVGIMLILLAEKCDAARLSFIQALCGSAAVSLENKGLLHAQKALFEAFIQLIAGAIDAKSPYTGGHCARVPELTKMLARAACADESGRFKDFTLSDDEWEAVHVAAWLHDCGKVTTPEYVVDKATKLETIHDRIHEVRMRFEVCKRDAEIDCLRAQLAGMPAEQARAQCLAEWQQLDDDFAFVAACNTGGESIAQADIERLRRIAQRTWLRTLDDRIGISHEELQRKSRLPASTLPVSEALIADRPEHCIERDAREREAAERGVPGLRMQVPPLLYNRGELYCLSVARGTLTTEERYKINEHIVQTLIMLSELPFPRHLRQVPEFAGCHHERMDGGGYPRGLTRDEMSPVARMMAIADIFEALTAEDRPYKRGKTLSEAIAIMVRMRDEQHIDAELFALFLRSGVYRDYAEKFLRPEQIDQVDLAACGC